MSDLLRDLVDRTALDRVDVVGLAVLLVGALVLAAVVTSPDPAPVPPPTAAGGTAAAPLPEAPEQAPAPDLTVHVTGEVVRGGLVVLPAGSRVGDAVAAAGGPTAAAVLAGVNLARPLADGEQVHVPDAADAVPGVGGTDAAGAALLPDGRLDLNRAGPADLEALPGVGEVTARRIVDWRGEHGPFRDPVQLREVRGIGEATWRDLRDLVAVGP